MGGEFQKDEEVKRRERERERGEREERRERERERVESYGLPADKITVTGKKYSNK